MSTADATARDPRVATLPELLALRGAAQGLSALLRRSADRLGGAHLAPFRGRGMEYAESRPYAVGDDARHVDWRLTARSGRLHSKLFQVERDRTTTLVMACDARLRFGTRVRFKSVQAARLGAVMLWAALAEGDRIAAACFGDRTGLLHPAGGRRGAMQALGALVQWSAPPDPAAPPVAPGAVALSDTLDRLARILRPGSRLLLLVDPDHLDAPALAALRRLRRHHDIAACLLVDALECEAPPPGRYRIERAGQVINLGIRSEADAAAWLAPFRRAQAAALEALRPLGVRVGLVRTDDDAVRALRAVLAGSEGAA